MSDDYENFDNGPNPRHDSQSGIKPKLHATQHRPLTPNEIREIVLAAHGLGFDSREELLRFISGAVRRTILRLEDLMDVEKLKVQASIGTRHRQIALARAQIKPEEPIWKWDESWRPTL